MPNTMIDFIDVRAPTVGSGTIEVLRNGAPGRSPLPTYQTKNHMWQNHTLAPPTQKNLESTHELHK